MTLHINWHRAPVRDMRGFTANVEGPFISGEAVEIGSSTKSAAAPEGAYYATVWADAPAHIAYGADPAADGTGRSIPANTMVQVAYGEVLPGVTKIAGLEI